MDSNTTSETHKKQDVTLFVKQSVTPAIHGRVTLSVKQSVTPAKQDQVTLSVKQSVIRNTVNDKESFTRTPTNTTYNKKKITLTPMKSPITQIKGGIKKLQLHKRKFFFQLPQTRKRKRERK